MARAPAAQTATPRRRGELVAGALLVLGAAAALAWANWPHSSYDAFWDRPHHLLHLTLRGWVDQVVLVAFFALVGLEIRREVVAGELGSLRRAAIPVAAAAVGMAVPALIYTAVVAGGPGAGAWGVPMATDVAFALAALGLVGRMPWRARVFLLTLAVADDFGAIAVLLVFYGQRVDPFWLVAAATATVALFALWWSRARAGPARLALAVLCWWSLLHGGVEASVAGAAIGAWGPRRRPVGGTPNVRVRSWIDHLRPFVDGLVLPAFALANVGVAVGGGLFTSSTEVRIFAAVVVARVVGKPVGILAGTWLARRVTRQPTQPRVAARSLAATGAVAGIGFTVPLLVIAAALPAGVESAAATAGLLAGSVVSVAVAAAVARVRPAGTDRE